MEENHIRKHTPLYPFSLLYRLGVGIRNKMFDWGLLPSESFDVPVICIGNLVTGGTGKTPHTEYLVRLLQKEFHVAVLSRGYKRKKGGYVLATPESTVYDIGDEPFQIHTKFPDIRVAVDKDRRHGLHKLSKLEAPLVDVVLLDDGYQHRYVNAGLNILLTDYHRLFCDDSLLPVGRLREPQSSKIRAQIVIVTKCPDDIKPIDYNIIAKRLKLYPYQQLYFSTYTYGDLMPVFPEQGLAPRPVRSISPQEGILLLTGIASPDRMVEELQPYSNHIYPLTFADHHAFTRKDIQRLKDTFSRMKEERRTIVTTEKDATRLLQCTGMDEELKNHLYALPVEAEILQNQQEIFNQYILGYVRKNKRNSILSAK